MSTPSALHAKIHQDPSFGWDPWPNWEVRPEVASAEFLAATGSFKGADTIGGDIGQLPLNLDMYASYVDNFGGWNELVAARESTGAYLLSITIFGGVAHCADVEPGAMAAAHLPNWLDIAIPNAGYDPAVPWVYTSASMMATANRFIGSRRVVRWSAHYGHGPHICGPRTCGFPQADWTQWDDKGANGQNIGRSVGTVLPTPVPTAPHQASGIANFAGHIDFDAGTWGIQGQPGAAITWGTDNLRWSAEIQVDGSNGTWDAQGLPFNAEIPTTGVADKGNHASGVANFSGSVNFDTGTWDIHGTSGSPTWGAANKYSAVLKIDNRFGDWHVIGCPFGALPMGA